MSTAANQTENPYDFNRVLVVIFIITAVIGKFRPAADRTNTFAKIFFTVSSFYYLVINDFWYYYKLTFLLECGRDIAIEIPHSFILLFFSLTIYFGKISIFMYFFCGNLHTLNVP